MLTASLISTPMRYFSVDDKHGIQQRELTPKHDFFVLSQLRPLNVHVGQKVCGFLAVQYAVGGISG